MKKYLSWKLFAILVVTLFLGFFNLPSETQTKIFPFTPDFVQKSQIYLGLDLRGGSQLDYRIDLRRVPEADRESIIEGVKSVIQKRVDSLGVAEPNIYTSELGGETHITVELAKTAVLDQSDVNKYLGEGKSLETLTERERQMVSLEKAKESVGKTIQLEFKERKTEPDPKEKDKIKEEAQAALAKIEAGDAFEVIGQEEQQAFPGRVTFERSGYVFESDLSPKIKEALKNLEAGEYTKELIELDGNFVLDPITQQTVQDSAYAILNLVETKSEIRHEKAVDTSHILISWAGLESADATVNRDKSEAYELAKGIRAQLLAEGDFAALAAEHSDDKSNKESGGKLVSPVTGDGTYVSAFEQAALELEESGISEVTETQFGYHIIKADSINENVTETQYLYKTIRYSTMQDMWTDTGLTGQHFNRADVEMDQFFQAYVSIQFNTEGARLFEEITGRNIGEPVAIFVGGELISAPTVQDKIAGGTAQISGNFTVEEAQTLARDLNTGAIPAPIVLTGEYTIGATLGQAALSMSLYAGFIGLLLVMLFMLLYYRFPGLLANLALAVYGIILIFLVKSELHVIIALPISLIIFGILVHKIVNSDDSGWEKLVSFVLTCVGLIFVTFLLQTARVLTLAGIAGIILSIGMAVDANILIFERIKEELRDGKALKNAIDIGFKRAWTAIRDSNFSTLITCAILMYFGSSMIKGFAFTLAAGILVSMFTALVITKIFFLATIGKKWLPQDIGLFGAKLKKERKPFRFIQKTKLWGAISGAMLALSIVSISVFGLHLGIDFTGGSLIELNFNEPIVKEQLSDALAKSSEKINSGDIVVEEIDSEEDVEATNIENVEDVSSEGVILSEAEQEELSIDLTAYQLIASGDNGFIIKTRHMTPEAHDQLIKLLRKELPEFTEERFTTIGPVVGAALLQRSVLAVIFALIIIIFYVAFAFRKIPKEVSPWRFGVSAIVALVHDVIIITGIFAALGYFLHVELDALFITALLTIFGYSVNDTIVVLDRLREKIMRDSDENLTENANKALTETLSRSINTSISTLLVLVAILLGGSSSIFYFILALTLGILVGTYSSIFVATPLLVLWKKHKSS
jgi:SecD/SecF fusion protein